MVNLSRKANTGYLQAMPNDVLEPHPLERLLQKPAADFTCSDLVEAVEQMELRQVNLRYVGGDGRLKTIAFPINSRDHLIEVLARGERVDSPASSRETDTGASDVYIVPRYRTAFLNPFGERPSLDVLCSFYGADGNPLPYAREQVVRRAAEVLLRETGMVLEAFGELEYYLVGEVDQLYEVEEERGYHESAPFSRASRCARRSWVILRDGHQAEVRTWRGREPHRGRAAASAARDRVLARAGGAGRGRLVMAKWVVREVAYRHGLEVTFAPSVSSDGAGSGLHIHSRLVRDGANAMMGDEGLNDTGRRLIAGYLSADKALTAVGNTVPTSYLRFADGDEAPEGISWGETDRTGLVRVPLAWGGDVLPGMVAHANADSSESLPEPGIHPQTVELRLADGSADVHLLLAGMAVAARHGLSDPKGLKRAARLSTADHDKFEQLPSSCGDSADALKKRPGVARSRRRLPK